MSARERVSPVDTAWLRMDRPTNLMIILAVWVLDGPVDLDAIETQVAEGLLGYRRFRQRIVSTRSGFFWEDDPHFEVGHHVRRMRLPGRGGKKELQRFVAGVASEPLDPNRPLWQVHVVEKFEGGAAIVFRLHHAIADGVALMGVTMSLVDGGPHAAAHDHEHADEGWLHTILTPVIGAIETGAETSVSAARLALDLARNPGQAANYARAGAGVAGELAWLLAMPSDSKTRFKGKPRGTKRVAWSEPLPLAEVRAVSWALGCSINDILMSCVAGAMRRYLAALGEKTAGVECRAMAPVNLRKPGDESLGNRFGLVGVELPVGIENPLMRLAKVSERMAALKSSWEPRVTLGLFDALGRLPKLAQDQLFDLIASRCTAVITNVPGPPAFLSVAGARLRQSLFWVPQSGDIGVGVSILSYAGGVQFGLVTDAALIPDPEQVIGRFADEFEAYLYYVLLDQPPHEAERSRLAEA